MIERLTIIGVGLLGGSIAKAARTRGLAREIVGIGRDLGRLGAGVRDGVLDRVTTDVVAGVREADLVILGAPVFVNEALLETIWPVVDETTVITDVGSTKSGLVRVAEQLGARRPGAGRTVGFVGSHPMAGSEKSGYAVARVDLLEGALVIVTPTETTEPRALKTVTSFWEGLGARVATLDPATHDRTVAVVSHLPHLVAMALVDAVARFEPGAIDFAGKGFKDTTRIAAGEPDVWREIFLANREAVAASLGAFSAALADLERVVRDGDAEGLTKALVRIKAARDAVR